VTTSDAILALAERSALVDRMVGAAAAGFFEPGAPGAAVSILAVGGYGRRELFPYSDIDLLLLFPAEKAAQDRKEAISGFLQSLWDSGLRVSQSVRTPAECAEVHDQNTELNVSLLDQRFLTGDRPLYASLAERLPRFLRASRGDLVRNLAALTRERHSRYGGTFYHLEPNVKETPGGLRDYQLVRWLEQLRDAGEPFAEASAGLSDAFRFLARVRFFLHRQSGRDNNLLSFENQDALAEISGGGDPARWMREYYRHSRVIYRAASAALENNEALASSLFAQFRDWRSRLANADFSVHRERAHFRAPQRLEVEPEIALRLFEFVATHGIRPSLEAAQRIEARLPRLREYFAEPPPLWPALQRILSLPHAILAVRSMHETGLLSAIFPELDRTECLVVRDFYHRYTVDEHTLVAMQNLLPAAEPFESLRGEVTDLPVLLFALLFHDSGKGSGAGHVAESGRLAAAAMARIQLPAAARETVLFLIRHHLELSAALQSRDLFDPAAIRDLATVVQTVERLKALVLITYADVAAVNPHAMSPWRATQLWQLYMSTYNELTRELQTDRIGAAPENGQSAATPQRAAFLEGFPTRYLRTHSEEEIAAHMALEETSRARGAAVEVRRLESAWQLTLATGADRPGLFASVAGTLSSFGMNILKAEAFSNRRGLVLDTFSFADPHRTLDLNPSEVDRLRATAARVIAGKVDVRELLRNRPKPSLPSRKARIPARVSFDSAASATATLIEIVAEDRPGLLYDLASAMAAHGANIEVVLIDTEAHKAIDVFYVTAAGAKLPPAVQEGLAEALRLACMPHP
jgi:[protein-PII] uridylyltransferase